MLLHAHGQLHCLADHREGESGELLRQLARLFEGGHREPGCESDRQRQWLHGH
jgi:hypothetical protein